MACLKKPIFSRLETQDPVSELAPEVFLMPGIAYSRETGDALKFELFVTRFTDGIRFDPTQLSADHCTDEAAKELLSRLDKKIQNIRRTRIHAV